MKVIEIQEDVRIGNIILEKGDQIEINDKLNEGKKGSITDNLIVQLSTQPVLSDFVEEKIVKFKIQNDFQGFSRWIEEYIKDIVSEDIDELARHGTISQNILITALNNIDYNEIVDELWKKIRI